MKNLNRYTEPDNYIDQSGRLIKLKWFALIAAVGIALLFFLSGCESQQYKYTIIESTDQGITQYHGTNSYTLSNGCVKFIDEYNAHQVICGNFKIQ